MPLITLVLRWMVLEKKNVVLVSNTCFVTAENGALWAWGRNIDGLLGLGHVEDTKVPQRVSIPEPIQSFFLKCTYTSGQSATALDGTFLLGCLNTWLTRVCLMQ